MGLVGFFLTPLTCQLSVDMLPTREFARRPHVWLDLISRNRGTISYSPSFGYELCARRATSIELDLSSWRVAGIGGDMIRYHILEDFAQRFASAGFDSGAFTASYGMAEATLAISFAPLVLASVPIRSTCVRLRRAARPYLPTIRLGHCALLSSVARSCPSMNLKCATAKAMC